MFPRVSIKFYPFARGKTYGFCHIRNFKSVNIRNCFVSNGQTEFGDESTAKRKWNTNSLNSLGAGMTPSASFSLLLGENDVLDSRFL